jgi:hypothetical protein
MINRVISGHRVNKKQNGNVRDWGNVTPCSPVEIYLSFRGFYWRHLQGKRMSQPEHFVLHFRSESFRLLLGAKQRWHFFPNRTRDHRRVGETVEQMTVDPSLFDGSSLCGLNLKIQLLCRPITWQSLCVCQTVPVQLRHLQHSTRHRAGF